MYVEHQVTCRCFHSQARENPEPVFDLSDCGLKTVPSGIYSLCKVFRKEALYLQVIVCLTCKSCSLDWNCGIYECNMLTLLFAGESVGILSRRGQLVWFINATDIRFTFKLFCIFTRWNWTFDKSQGMYSLYF